MQSSQEVTRSIEKLRRHVAELQGARDLREGHGSEGAGGMASAGVKATLRSLAGEVDELREAIEELQAADEELREQHEELVRLRERLEAERQKYRSLFNDAPDAYLVTDLGGNILQSNRAAAAMLGVPRARLSHRPVAQFVAARDRSRLWVQIDSMSGSDRTCDFELLIQPREGPAIDVAIRVAPIVSRARRAAGLRWLIRDITRRKRAEQMLQASLIQLRQSERLASVGTLAAGIAHEIRNPLSDIVLAVECAARSDERARTGQMLAAIQAGAGRIAHIVKSVLQFARDEETPKERADLNEVILHTADVIRACLPDKGVTLELKLSAELPEIPLNRTEMEQAVVSLVRNAAEAAGGPVRVIVRTAMEDAGVRLVVEDDGPGIPREHIEHIFDPFFTTHQEDGRIGLGLSIVHNIISDHGGSVSIRSRAGEGSAFTIRLPVPGRG